MIRNLIYFESRQFQHRISRLLSS